MLTVVVTYYRDNNDTAQDEADEKSLERSVGG